MLVFLDLEETLVTNWGEALPLPTNLAMVRSLVPQGATVGLMSWAVWDDKDKEKFNRELRPELESLLGFAFDDSFVWSMDDWCKQLLLFLGKKVSRDDLFDCFSKHEVLFMVSRCHPLFTGKEVVLVDDAVEHMLSWTSVKNDCKVSMVNIKDALKG